MTGQVSDQYRYKGEAYSLIALSDPINFLPEDYGLNPASACSLYRTHFGRAGIYA